MVQRIREQHTRPRTKTHDGRQTVQPGGYVSTAHVTADGWLAAAATASTIHRPPRALGVAVGVAVGVA